jgi:hypothetical protein
MIAAPAGWGYVPGTNLAPEPEELPDIPRLHKMTRNQAMRAVAYVLMEHPQRLKTVSGMELKRRYPSADIRAMYESIMYARLGNIPKPKGRPALQLRRQA